MHDPSFMALALIIFEKMTKTQKLEKRQRTVKSRSSLKIEHKVDLNSSRCMHDPFHGSSPYSFIENDLNAKTRHLSVNLEK